MSDEESIPTAPPLLFGRGKSFGLYLGVAALFALCMFLISLIPGYEGGGRAIRYQSFGPLCLDFVCLHLFDSNGGLLRHFPIPEWSSYTVSVLVGVLYSLLIVMPLYFYFRTRRAWLLGVQALTLAGHAAFALCVVARFWIHM
jgi:hypothetical protein